MYVYIYIHLFIHSKGSLKTCWRLQQPPQGILMCIKVMLQNTPHYISCRATWGN